MKEIKFFKSLSDNQLEFNKENRSISGFMDAIKNVDLLESLCKEVNYLCSSTECCLC